MVVVAANKVDIDILGAATPTTTTSREHGGTTGSWQNTKGTDPLQHTGAGRRIGFVAMRRCRAAIGVGRRRCRDMIGRWFVGGGSNLQVRRQILAIQKDLVVFAVSV